MEFSLYGHLAFLSAVTLLKIKFKSAKAKANGISRVVILNADGTVFEH
ncbi:MAG: hypothetical protein IPO68_06325 [Chitinophagaceae bacterium]|nr:hypothetical protein [Chitinophagaceae bacterium]